MDRWDFPTIGPKLNNRKIITEHVLVGYQQVLGPGCWKGPHIHLTDICGQSAQSIYKGSCLWPQMNALKRHTPHQPAGGWFIGTRCSRKSSRALLMQPKSESTINLSGKQVYKLKLCLNKHLKLKCWTEPQNMSSFFYFYFYFFNSSFSFLVPHLILWQLTDFPNFLET